MYTSCTSRKFKMDMRERRTGDRGPFLCAPPEPSRTCAAHTDEHQHRFVISPLASPIGGISRIPMHYARKLISDRWQWVRASDGDVWLLAAAKEQDEETQGRSRSPEERSNLPKRGGISSPPCLALTHLSPALDSTALSLIFFNRFFIDVFIFFFFFVHERVSLFKRRIHRSPIDKFARNI